jgi:hypothetical protein
MSPGLQAAYLFLLAIPVACISWTVTHEEIFKEPRELCKKYGEQSKTLFIKKFFYVLTCEYCFSHYVAIAMLLITDYQLLFNGWRGYLVAGFSLVWVANIYMSLYSRVRLDIKKERIEIDQQEKDTS